MNKYHLNCVYVTAKRQCLLLTAYTPERNAGPLFCLENCGPLDEDKRAMLLGVYGIQPPEQLPKPEELDNKKGCGGCGDSRIRLIVQGVTRYVADQILGRQPEPWMISRLEKCSQCPNRTFLSIVDWGMNLMKMAGDLPVNHKPGRFDRMWCSKCKCCVEIMIRAKDKECVIGEWDGIDPEADYVTVAET